eukprot:tig00020563_g11347.t1
MLGNNNNTDPAYTPSLAWTWVTLKFPALSGPALPYLKKDGSTYTVLVRQTCMTLKADAINIDYMAVNFVYACDGEETPTPTPTPVTPTPTEAPPAPPTPTPKPEPCTKDVAALPKSLETAKADYILPGLSSVSVMRTASNKCTGVYDCWGEYVEFKSGTTEATRSKTNITLALNPIIDTAAKAEALSALQLEVKMRGAHAPRRALEINIQDRTRMSCSCEILWVWEVYNYDTKNWVMLGNNNNTDPAYTPSLAWTWVTLKFPALSGPALPYLKKDGSTYTVLVRQTCMTLKADAINIDYMAVNFVYACDGEETPTPTPTPVTPTPTEAPPAPPTPTPKPEPCTKDVAALPKSLETAKADYILPGLSSVSVMRTASNKCTGVYDCWGEYVEFKSGTTEATRSKTNITLALNPIIDTAAKAEALSALQLEVKMRGAHAPRRALEINIQDRTRMSCSCEILWVWEVYNYDTKNWVMLGNNNNTDPAYTPSLAWTWVTLKFPALSGPASPYLKKDGSTYSVLVRQTCATLKADAINIDYMAVNFVYCDEKKTPTPTPTGTEYIYIHYK